MNTKAPTLTTPRAPSRALLHAAAIFGLGVEVLPPSSRPPADASDLPDPAAPGVTLITGPSGAGKSTLLRRLSVEAERRGVRTVHARAPRDGRALIDLAGGDAPTALRRLAAAGLAEAALLGRTAGTISEGERARLALALALRRAEGAASHAPALIVADEFCSTLDRLTAQGVAGCLRRRIGAGRIAVLVAAAHEDTPGLLAPDRLIRVAPGGAIRVDHGPRVTPGHGCVIEPGSIADFDRLAPHHYLGGRPAAPQRTLRAVHRASGVLAGVLVVSAPTRRGAWRSLAWPGRYRTIDAAGLRRLNNEVRRISRVVIDPRLRGLGLAADLVRAYLADPLTPATEAVAAMGAVCPFFERAGMTSYPLGLAAAEQRLADALEACGLAPFDLLGPAPLAALARRELDRWHASRRDRLPMPVRRAIDASPDDTPLRRAAAFRLSGAATAYAHAR